MIVLDASVVIDWLLRGPAAIAVDDVLEAGESLHAPQLLYVESAQVLRRLALSDHLTADRGSEALLDLAALPLATYPHDPFLSRVWELRSDVSAYDAVYLALAETLRAPLMTLDHRLTLAAHAHATCQIIEPVG